MQERWLPHREGCSCERRSRRSDMRGPRSSPSAIVVERVRPAVLEGGCVERLRTACEGQTEEVFRPEALRPAASGRLEAERQVRVTSDLALPPRQKAPRFGNLERYPVAERDAVDSSALCRLARLT